MAKKLKAPSKTSTYQRVRKEVTEWVFKNSTLMVDNSRWYVGITNNGEARKRAHEVTNDRTCKFWRIWDMKSVRLSLALETSLHKSGMLETDAKGNYKEDSKYLYVYKKYPTILD